MSTPATGRRAPASCFPCRRSKRRCDKSMPACQLCSRKRLKCTYPQRRGQRSASPIESTRGTEWTVGGADANANGTATARTSPVPGSISASRGRNGLTVRSSSQSQPPPIPFSFARATAIGFLAPNLPREASLEVPHLDLDIPDEIALHLGDWQQIRETTAEFFQLTRSWISIVSPRRHLAAVLNPLSPCRRPNSLLALCMKLCCLPGPRRDGGDGEGSAERTLLYRLIKRFYAEVESTEGLCLQVLQAAVLIAVFEIGDAIYPAAYLTVGACARYGIAMGLDKVNKARMGGGTASTSTSTGAASWMDIEERRRVWWGVLILDRFLNHESPNRSLATEDPAFEDFLPVDDDKFYNAAAVPEDADTISQAFTYEIGQFRRLAQATYLIRQVLVTIQSSPIAPDTHNHSHSHANTRISRPMDTAQLCRTLDALIRANEVEATLDKLAFCCQSLVSFSGILFLQGHHWSQMDIQSTKDTERHTFPETRNALDTLYRIALFLQQGSEIQVLLQGQCTFFLASVVYHALSALVTMGRGDPSAELRGKIEALRWLLGFLGERWPVSGVYLSIIEAKEALLAAEAL